MNKCSFSFIDMFGIRPDTTGYYMLIFYLSWYHGVSFFVGISVFNSAFCFCCCLASFLVCLLTCVPSLLTCGRWGGDGGFHYNDMHTHSLPRPPLIVNIQ